MNMRTGFLFFVAIALASCSGMERSENEKLRRRNCKGEYIYRNHNEYLYAIQTPLHTPRDPYPWEGGLPRITKEYFRCKGSPESPPHTDLSNPDHPVPALDCEGSTRHGLPIIHAKEGVYPILIELLNYVQQKTKKRVIITCGHRCPAHNTYSDASKKNLVSKHQIGAEVDFYVQGMEDRPQEVVDLLLEYYRGSPRGQGKKEFEFQRYTKEDAGVATQPWLNQEIFIKLHAASEGRDEDNHHPYPYVTIQVRYDVDAKEKVVYEWKRAHLGYPRG